MERYLDRRDATRPDGDEALFVKRCDEFARENPGILEYYRRSLPGCVLEVSHVSHPYGLFALSGWCD